MRKTYFVITALSSILATLVSHRNRFTSRIKFFSLLLLVLLVSGESWGATTTYTFSSNAWATTSTNWTSKLNGNAFTSGQGIQVTTGSTGACGNSPISFANVTSVKVNYCTNTSSGAGTINVFSVASSSAAAQSGTRIGSSTAVSTSGGTTVRALTFNTTAITGNIQIYVTCTTNSVYINSVEITYTTNDQTSKVADPTSQITAGNIASTVTTSGGAVDAFKFKISDLATADALSTKVTQVKIVKTGTAVLNTAVAGAQLWNGGTQITTGTPTISTSDITFPITSGNLDIASGTSTEITMKVYLTSSVTDNSTLVFSIPQTSHGYTADAAGSTFATDFGAAVTGNTMTITVAATKLLFTTAPSTTACPNTTLSTPPVVKATDANGNVDSDFTGPINITNSGSLSMSGYQITNATAGVANFSSLQFTTIGSCTLSTTNSNSLTDAPATASITVSASPVTGVSATNGNTNSSVSWTYPASCYDEIIIVAHTASISGTPTGTYTAASQSFTDIANPDFPDGGKVVFNGTAASPKVIADLTNSTTYYFKIFSRKGSFWSTGVQATATPVLSTTATDYFRTAATGNWGINATWESSPTGVDGSWISATATPTSAANTITIRNGHTVTVAGAVTVDQVVISSGGILEANLSLTVNDGTGDDIVIESGGTLKYSTNSSYASFTGSSPTISNETGGLILVSGTAIVNNLQNANYIFKNASILEYSSSSVPAASGVTFFPNADNNTIPIFKISGSIGSNVGGGTSTVVNGILEVTGSVSWAGNSSKTFRNGIRGNGSVTQTTAYQFIVNGATAEIGGGTLTLLAGGGLTINSGTIATLSSNKTINTGPITLNGTLDFGTFTLSGTSAFTLASGATLKTANASGVAGSITVSGTKTFNSAANYEFKGNSSVAITTTPTANTVNSLTVSNNAEVSLSTNLSTNTLNIALGSTLNVPAAKQLTVSGALTNNGTLNLLSSASGTATLTNGSFSGSGTASVEQTLGADRNWYLSSPVSAASIPTADNVWYYDETVVSTNLINSWKSPTNGTTLEVGKGYIVNPTSGTIAKITFNGTLNSGNQPAVTLRRTAAKSSGVGFNLLGNPYPSYINSNALLNDASNTGILKTIWYRTHDGTNWSNPTFNAEVGIGVPTDNLGFIPPMQAFWVRATADNVLFYFKDAMRLHNTTGSSIPFKAPAATANQILRLKVADGNIADEAVVYFNVNATNEFDNYDSPKMLNGSTSTVPDIYTLVGAEKLVINGLKDIPYGTEIPLYFKANASTATSYTLVANEISNFEAGTVVYIKNNLTKQIQLISDGSAYAFEPSVVGIDPAFSLIIKAPGTVTDINGANSGKINIFANQQGQISVITPELIENGLISVYNAVGQKLLSRGITTNVTVLKETFVPGVYVVKVNNVSRKVIVK